MATACVQSLLQGSSAPNTSTAWDADQLPQCRSLFDIHPVSEALLHITHAIITHYGLESRLELSPFFCSGILALVFQCFKEFLT